MRKISHAEEERVGRLSGVLHTFEVRKLIMSPYVGEWCRLPYPGHKRGCPKYGTSPDCPPRAIFIGGLMDLCGPIFLVYAQFDLQAHMAKMKEKHPGWTERQCRNVLYWQGAVRAELKRNVAAAMGSLGCNAVTYCPEGNGVNVYATARTSGLRLERIKGLKIDRHVALIGRAVNSE